MALIIKAVYEPPIDTIRKEGDLISLLKDVWKEADDFSRLPTSRLNYALALVQGEDSNSRKRVGVGNLEYEIDFSRARSLIDSYRELSEGGCNSCISCERLSENMENYLFCCEYENKFDIDMDKGTSPRIRMFFKKGCNEIKRYFRPIEEILEGVE